MRIGYVAQEPDDVSLDKMFDDVRRGTGHADPPPECRQGGHYRVDPLKAQALRDKFAADGMVVNMAAG
ncbi:hypothetical protein AB4156_39670 [Cupriavidus sp. 2MCAB6]|uniref:hypothetical protein n=1 Tax=Cupriavidus sp. 2MCAB6 TaxID=3232981 RepID=UPI003F92D3FC